MTGVIWREVCGDIAAWFPQQLQERACTCPAGEWWEEATWPLQPPPALELGVRSTFQATFLPTCATCARSSLTSFPHLQTEMTPAQPNTMTSEVASADTS